MLYREQGEIVCMFPDMVVMLEPGTGRGVMSVELREGLELGAAGDAMPPASAGRGSIRNRAGGDGSGAVRTSESDLPADELRREGTMPETFNIMKDENPREPDQGPLFVTMGEVMVRDTPADMERPERTRLVHLSMAGSEYTLAMGLSRLGIPPPISRASRIIPTGAPRVTFCASRVSTLIFWCGHPKPNPSGAFIYEIGRTPRRDTGIYQRMYSAASKLDAGMVNWSQALKDARLLHTSGITFGLARHSRYERNYNLEAVPRSGGPQAGELSGRAGF